MKVHGKKLAYKMTGLILKQKLQDKGTGKTSILSSFLDSQDNNEGTSEIDKEGVDPSQNLTQNDESQEKAGIVWCKGETIKWLGAPSMPDFRLSKEDFRAIGNGTLTKINGDNDTVLHDPEHDMLLPSQHEVLQNYCKLTDEKTNLLSHRIAVCSNRDNSIIARLQMKRKRTTSEPAYTNKPLENKAWLSFQSPKEEANIFSNPSNVSISDIDIATSTPIHSLMKGSCPTNILNSSTKELMRLNTLKKEKGAGETSILSSSLDYQDNNEVTSEIDKESGVSRLPTKRKRRSSEPAYTNKQLETNEWFVVKDTHSETFDDIYPLSNLRSVMLRKDNQRLRRLIVEGSANHEKFKYMMSKLLKEYHAEISWQFSTKRFGNNRDKVLPSDILLQKKCKNMEEQRVYDAEKCLRPDETDYLEAMAVGDVQLESLPDLLIPKIEEFVRNTNIKTGDSSKESINGLTASNVSNAFDIECEVEDRDRYLDDPMNDSRNYSIEKAINQGQAIPLPIQENQISSMNSDVIENITSNDGIQESVKHLKEKSKQLIPKPKTLGISNPKRSAAKRIKYRSNRHLRTVCKKYNLRDVDIEYTQEDYQRIQNFNQFCQKYEEVIKSANLVYYTPFIDSSIIKEHLLPAKWKQFTLSRPKNNIDICAQPLDTSHKDETVSPGESDSDRLGPLKEDGSKQLTEIEDEESNIVEEMRNIDERRRILIDRLAELRHHRNEVR